MNCKECTCYVDGHSKKGNRVPSGNGLCTMYDQDVSADRDCSYYASANANSKNIKSRVATTYVTNIPKQNKKPRKGMKAWATVCFIFAAIYALMGFVMDSMMFGMTAFCSVLGIMFIVLSKSPKQDPYLFGKQKGMQKKTFVIFCIVAAFCAFVIAGGTPTDAEVGDDTNSSDTTEYTDGEISVSSISDFRTTEYEMLVGDVVDLELELRPKNLTANDIVIEISDASVLSVSELNLTTEGRKTILTFKCTANGEGSATLVVKSSTGDKTSNTVSFEVSTPPLIAQIGRFNPSYATQEVGDVRTITVPMKPNDLTEEDIIIENSDESIISVTNIAITYEDDKTILTFDVTGVGVGKASIKIKGADGKTESNELQFTINEKDTSRTVYVTPYGEKYHLSAACAGKNATKTTENKAIHSGKERCKKCG